ncbi:MAG: hypothetical protein ACR2NW_06545 [Thermodesulfobacteriota bacterium]
MINNNWIFIISIISFILLGCTTNNSRYYSLETEERLDRLVQASSIRNICEYGHDCQVKWKRVVSWLELNSKWNIEIQNNELIKTYGPSPESVYEAYKVRKTPLDTNGFYEIVFIVRCGTVPNCNEKSVMATANFKYYVENGISLEPNASIK